MPSSVSERPNDMRYFLEILDDETRSRAYQLGNKRYYKNKELLIRQGEKSNGIQIILSGVVESLYEDGLGQELILAVWHTGDFIGGPYIVGNHTQSWSARALGKVDALHLDQECLRKCVAESTTFALAIIECLGYKGERYSRLAQVLATHTTTERLALLLLELSKTNGMKDGANVKIGTIGQSKLSHMIGATRQSVSLVLQKLEDNEIIKRSPTCISILNMEALNSYAGSNKV